MSCSHVIKIGELVQKTGLLSFDTGEVTCDMSQVLNLFEIRSEKCNLLGVTATQEILIFLNE